MLRLTATFLLTASLAAQPLVTRTIGEIPPPTGEGAAGRVLVLEQQGDDTIAIRTRTPYFTPSLAELAVTRIPANGAATTTSVATIDAPNGIFGGDGAVTSNGYFVAWNDGGIHAAFIDRSFRLQAATTLPLYSPLPFASASRNVVVRCTARRCLVAWWEYDNTSRIAGSLFDTSGNLLVSRIQFTDVYREPFTTFFSVAATPSRFMIANWTGTYDNKNLQVIPVDENGRRSTPVVLLESEHQSPSVVAIASMGDDFAVVRASWVDDRSVFSAESIDASGAVRRPWHPIASTPDFALYALHLLGTGAERLLALESAPGGIGLIEGAIPYTFLNVIRLDSDLEAIDQVPIILSELRDTNDSPKIVRTPRGQFIAWNHGVAAGFRAYANTSPRFVELATAGPAPRTFNGGRPFFDGPAKPLFVDVAATNDQYAVLRLDSAVRSDPSVLSVSLVSRSGDVRDPLLIAGPSSQQASIASDGNDWLISWAEDSNGFFMRTLHRDGTLGTVVQHYGHPRVGALIWDGREYATLINVIDYDVVFSLEIFDRSGTVRGDVPRIGHGQPLSMAGSEGRIAIGWTAASCNGCESGTMVTVVDSGSQRVLAQTRIGTEYPWGVWMTAAGDHFLAFVQSYRKLSIFELDRDGKLLAPEPFVVPVEEFDAIFSIIPIGTNHVLFGAREGKAYVRIIDVAAQRASDPMPLLQGSDQLVGVDPGAGGSVVTLSLHAVRGAEMEGASTIVGELFLPPGARRHAF